MTLTVKPVYLVLKTTSQKLMLRLGTQISIPGPAGPQGPPGSVGDRIVLSDDTDLELGAATYVNADTEIVATLPTSAEIGSTNYKATFILAHGQNFRVQAQGSDVIRWFGMSSPPGGWMENDEIDAVLEIAYIGAGVFTVTNAVRNWIFGPETP